MNDQSSPSSSKLDEILKELEEKFSPPQQKHQSHKKSASGNFSKNQIIGSITLVLLLVGGIVSSYLGQKEQDVRQRAADPPYQQCTNNDGWCRGGIQPGEQCTTWWTDHNGTCVVVDSVADICDCVVLGTACCSISSNPADNFFTDYNTCKSRGGTQTRPEFCQSTQVTIAPTIAITIAPTSSIGCQPGTQQSTHRECQGSACVTVENATGVCDNEENNQCDNSNQCFTPPQNTLPPTEPTTPPVLPTNTSVPRPTNTSVPTTPGQPTNTPVTVPTNTAVPLATATLTVVPSSTIATATNTPITALIIATTTTTNTPTNTLLPTPTDTQFPTNTSVPTTPGQPTYTPVPIPTNTNQPLALQTQPTPIPTNIRTESQQTPNLPSAGNTTQTVQLILGAVVLSVIVGVVVLLLFL